MLGFRWSGCGRCAAHVMRWPATATSSPSPLLDPTTVRLRRRFLNLSEDSSGGRSWPRCRVTNEISSVAARSTEVIEMEYADLNLKDFYGANPQVKQSPPKFPYFLSTAFNEWWKNLPFFYPPFLKTSFNVLAVRSCSDPAACESPQFFFLGESISFGT